MSAQARSKAKPKATTSKSAKVDRRKLPKKQPSPLLVRLKQLFSRLCAQVDGGHFKQAIKTCDKILQLEPRDQDALQTKRFLLLQTEQYDKALSLIGESDGNPEILFERAYSLYRLQREAEATAILDRIENTNNEDRGKLHLEAQLHYRGGSYQAAFDAYNVLLDTAEPQSEEQADILTNLQASQKLLDFIDQDYLRVLDALPTPLTTSLETLPPPAQPASSLAAVLASSSAAATSESQLQAQEKAKKARASRVPKGVIPGVTPPPDPERWLKKSERSTFGQGNRRRKGGGGGGGATQGSTVESASSGNPSKGQGKGKKKK